MVSASSFLVVLLFISPFYEAAEEVKIKRKRRSLVDLAGMVLTVTRRDPMMFVQYGNYCGLGGSGKPIDPIDKCCQNHDECYDVAYQQFCLKYGEKSVYQLKYKWSVAVDGTVVCGDYKERCRLDICKCDAVFSKCLKRTIDVYDSKNRKMDIWKLLGDAMYAVR